MAITILSNKITYNVNFSKYFFIMIYYKSLFLKIQLLCYLFLK